LRGRAQLDNVERMTVPQKPAVRNRQKKRRTKKLAAWRQKKAKTATKTEKKTK
jgi:hypothetical protein